MNIENLIDILFKRASEYKIEEIEVYLKSTESMKLNIYESNLEKYIVEKDEGLSLRGIYNGKMGYSYTEKFEEDSIEELIKNLIDYAENNTNEELESISSNKIEIENSDIKNLLSEYSDDEKISFLFKMEKEAYESDKRVKKISRCSYEEVKETVFIKNNKGLELRDTYSYASIELGTIVEENNKMQSGYSDMLIKDLSEEYKDIVLNESVNQAISMLNSKPIETGKYKTIIKNNVASNLLGYFSNVFLGNIVQQNLSLLKGKINSQVAVDFLNIVEDPQMDNGRYSRKFDDEGNQTFKKNIIENGVLKTFLHNNMTARKENINSTGNGFRQNHKSSIDVMGTNIFVEEGKKSLEELIKEIENGILITEIHGLHAGINTVSGDFSLSANGILIEEGKLTESVSQITVAGNLYDMMKNLKAIGSDMKFTYNGSNYFGSPSINIGETSISGK